MKLDKLAIPALLAAAACANATAQGTSYYEDTSFDPFQRKLYFVGKDRPHTAFRSYQLDELNTYFDTDSLIFSNINRRVNTRARIFNDFFNDDFLHWQSPDEKVFIAINPLFDWEVGTDKYEKESKTTWINSRGFYLNGNLGKNFWFYCDFSEVQADYANYYNHLADSLNTVPGLSNFKAENNIDYEVATGYIAFNVGPWVDFLIGKTKTFIGDGYRSLLLSDAAVAVPTFRINLNILRAHYSMMMTQFKEGHRLGNVSNNGFRSRYSFTHFLEWNMGRRVTVGLFENVTQASWRKTGETRGIDLEYLNPFVIFRPGEFNAGSPDKMIVGLTAKFICTDWATLYGQLMFNEFRIKELINHPDYWSNKYAFQFGLKMFDIFKVDGLDFQAEYNQARPYCYSQFDAMGCYTHLNQSMAHPLGANFKEGVFILNYHHGRARARAQLNVAKYGDDFPKDTISYGHNPNVPSDNRPSQYGMKTLQGLKTDLKYFDLSGSFIINPRNMMNVTAGFRYRTRQSEQTDEHSRHLYVALRWNLKSKYYDY